MKDGLHGMFADRAPQQRAVAQVADNQRSPAYGPFEARAESVVGNRSDSCLGERFACMTADVSGSPGHKNVHVFSFRRLKISEMRRRRRRGLGCGPIRIGHRLSLRRAKRLCMRAQSQLREL